MTILLVNRQPDPSISGVASYFENISAVFLKLGYGVRRLVGEKHLPPGGKFEYSTFRYTEKLPWLSRSERLKRIEKNQLLFEKSLEKLNWQEITLVIAANDIYVPALKKKISVKKIIVIVPSFLSFSKEAAPKDYQQIVQRMKKNLKDVRIVVLSNLIKKMLEKYLGYGYKISLVYPGVDLKRFKGTSKNKTHGGLLYVGRLDKEKNVQALLKAFYQIKSPCTLTLVGDGDQVKPLRRLVRKVSGKEIIFVGRKKQVEKYYAKNQIFLFPSKFEAFGLVLLEAMASSLAVIAFRPSSSIITASNEIISHGQTGFLVKDTWEMAAKTDFLLADDSLIRKIGGQAALQACQFTWLAHVKKILSLNS